MQNTTKQQSRNGDTLEQKIRLRKKHNSGCRHSKSFADFVCCKTNMFQQRPNREAGLQELKAKLFAAGGVVIFLRFLPFLVHWGDQISFALWLDVVSPARRAIGMIEIACS
jgi:hypothetical protein